MTVHSTIESYRPEQTQIVIEVFQTMLGLKVEPAEGAWCPATPPVTGAVYYAGTWNGAVMIECTQVQAFQFTARLLSSKPPTSVNDAVRDTLGELANIIAGNLKAVLPFGVVVSMPMVVEGTDYSLHVFGNHAVSQVTLASALGAFRITLVEMRSGERGRER